MTNCCCLCCCSSHRGAAFFSSSVQIFVGAYLFMKWVLSSFVNGTYDDYLFDDSRMQYIYPMLVVYILAFLILGFVSFIAIDKKKETLLKWTTWLLLLLQGFELSCHVILGFFLPDPETDLDIHRIYHIKFLTLGFIGSTLYFICLFLYIGHLKRSYILGEARDDDDNLTIPRKKKKMEFSPEDFEEERRPSAPLASSIEEPDFGGSDSLPYKKTQV